VAIFPALMLLLFGLIYAGDSSRSASFDYTAPGILIGAALFFIGILADGRIAAEGSLDELRGHVPGDLLLVMQTDSPEMAKPRASELDWAWRDYGGNLTFLLPERVTIPEVVGLFDGVPLQSLTLEDVGLEHIYLEVTQSANHDSLSTPATNSGG
jgi:ABC-2 type transport system ATP-binding protein